MEDERTSLFLHLDMFENRLAALGIIRYSPLRIRNIRSDVGEQPGRYNAEFMWRIWMREEFERDLEERREVGLCDFAVADIRGQGSGYV